MATINVTNAQTFVSGDEVNPNNLNALGLPTVTISDIVNADISASAAITAGKLAGTLDLTGKTVTLPLTSVNAAALATDAVETAKIKDAAVTAGKLSGAQSGTAPVFGCRAWVMFDGTRNAADSGPSVVGGTVKIFASGNVASVVRTATATTSVGRFTVNFATAMPSATYAAVANYNELNSDLRNNNGGQASCHAHATGSVQVVVMDEGGADTAPQRVSVLVFG